MMKATINKMSSLFLGALIMACLSVVVNAQTNPSFDNGKFVFFIDGANVQIPTVDGTVIADPDLLTPNNKVLRLEYADYSERGFKWPTNGEAGTVGIDASGAVGENYGESDTLYVRFWSDSLNRNTNADFIGFLDTENGTLVGEDLAFRLKWTIPLWAKDEQWHELAIPLPPMTNAQLDSAKKGLKANGEPLDVEVDSLFQFWNYAGAWAGGSGTGVACCGGSYDNDPDADPNFMEFQWNSVKTFGRHADFNSGGGDMLIDYFSIGVPPSELVDAAPAQLTTVEVASDDGANVVTWGAGGADVGGYNVYFSESEITDVAAENVERLATVPYDAELTYSHKLQAPHASLASDFEAHYAVTATSNFGSQSTPTGTSITSDISVNPNYAVELGAEGLDVIFTALGDGVVPDGATIAGFFPDSYAPFEINETNKVVENGDGGDDDADISGKFWVGFDSEANFLIIYAEITDDAFVFAAEATGGNGAWNYDSWEGGLANYSPASFVQGSTHQNFEGGDEPDYQFRAGMFNNAAPFMHANGGGNAFDGEIPNSQTIGDSTSFEGGYRLLSVISTIELSGGEAMDKAFDFPSGTEVTTYPMQLGLNDADVSTRETQITYSPKGGQDDWWNTPARWAIVAFVGSEAVVSNEDVDNTKPNVFSLDQNYPNPFNPSTNITFNLATTSDVTLEVYNMLGQKVATLIQGEKMNAGSHTQKFDASAIASGMYLYRLSTPSFVQTRKMMLIK